MIRRCLAYIGVVALASTVTVIGAPGIASADEVRDDQWYLETLGISDAHELSQGEGVTIGVIDSGIDATHPDLENNVEAGKDYGKSKDDGLNDARDHGTNIASILAGHGHGDDNQSGVLGIAPKATVISVGVDWRNRGDPVGDWMCDAIEWLTQQEVDVISTSLGAASCTTKRVVQKTAEQGIPVVASAGNTQQEFEGIEYEQESGTGWPATLPHAIPVSGTTKDGEFWDGSLTLEGAAPQTQFGLSAPATDLPGAMPGGDYATNSGTSGSAPIVAGTLALIKSAYPDLDYTTWVARMLETVEDKGDEGYDDKYGHGIVNPLQALTEDVKFKDEYSDIESLAEDRLPLEEQGKDTGSDGDSGDEGNDDEGTADGNPIAAATNGLPMWMIIAIITGLLIVTAGIITPIVLTQRRKRRQVGPPPADGTGGPGGPPPGPGSPPPGPPSGPPHTDPGNPTAAPPGPPPGTGTPPPGSTSPGPPPPDPEGAGSPTSAPPATQHNPQTPTAGQPNMPPQQPPAPGHPQTNPPGGATPPGSNAPFTPPQ